MSRSDLAARLSFLRQSQNADGGWGYFPGKISWLEPTMYAAFALHADPGAGAAVDRAWALMRSLQRPDGAWRPTAGVGDAHWTTSLCLNLHMVRGVHDEVFARGLQWLLTTAGAEGTFWIRVVHFLKPSLIEYDASVAGWPWRTVGSSWVEPTAHALFALKKAARQMDSRALRRRVDDGERMLLDRRAVDEGWNYGNRRVLGITLPSYGETTALALHGLQGNHSPAIGPSLKRALEHYRSTRSPLARAWLAIVLRNYGDLRDAPGEFHAAGNDVMIGALEAIAAPEGSHRLFRLEAS